jgi:hypothetical protein
MNPYEIYEAAIVPGCKIQYLGIQIVSKWIHWNPGITHLKSDHPS